MLQLTQRFGLVTPLLVRWVGSEHETSQSQSGSILYKTQMLLAGTLSNEQSTNHISLIKQA